MLFVVYEDELTVPPLDVQSSQAYILRSLLNSKHQGWELYYLVNRSDPISQLVSWWVASEAAQWLMNSTMSITTALFLNPLVGLNDWVFYYMLRWTGDKETGDTRHMKQMTLILLGFIQLLKPWNTKSLQCINMLKGRAGSGDVHKSISNGTS